MADPVIIECIWTTGAAVLRYSFLDDGFYDEELVVSANAVRLERLNAGAPLLNAHKTDDVRHVVGTIVPGSARIEAGRGLARLRLSGEAADTDIVGKIRDGIITGVSVGYVRHRIEKVESPNLKRPIHRVTDWEPKELTVCAIGADPGAMLLRANAPFAEAARIRMELAARLLRTNVPAAGMRPAPTARVARARMALAERWLTA